jgi:hypothetical protein
MYVGKFLWWDRNVLWDSVSVVVTFGRLTSGTLTSLVGNVGGHGMPDKAGRDEEFCDADTRVG